MSRHLRRLCVPAAAALLLLLGTVGLLELWSPSEQPHSSGGGLAAPPHGVPREVANTFGRLPLRFEQNRGQSDPRVRFIARGGGYTLFLTSDEAVLALQAAGARPDDGRRLERAQLGGPPGTREAPADATLRLRFVGANRAARIVGLDQLPGQTNYLVGNDPARWQRNVPSFERVRYEALYPGIALVYYGNQGRLEYDLDVAPGASPQRIRLNVEGARGLELDRHGDLLIRLAGGVLRQHKPVAYQRAGNALELVPVEYVLLAHNQVGFHLADYDRSRALIIDPVLDYATYLGGEAFDYAWDVAVDGAGNAYVVGTTRSTDFPTTTLSYDPRCGTDGACNGGHDGFVIKLAHTDNSLVYATYLGGSDSEDGYGIAVDGAGNAYVAGSTGSTDFPTTTLAYDGGCGNGGSVCNDGFVSKLNPAGDALVYSTYLGGDGAELANGIAVNDSGQAFVVGTTYSPDFPTTEQAYDRICGTNGDCTPFAVGPDAFITAIADTGNALVYSSFLGGGGYDLGEDVAVDGRGHAYLTGSTGSTDFPTTTQLYEPNCARSGSDNPCDSEIFVAKIDSGAAITGSLAFAAILGGAGLDDPGSITADADGNMYVTGGTQANDFPTTPGAYDRRCAFDGECYGAEDGFVAKINPALSGPSAFLYGTYLGGSSDDRGLGLAIDDRGNAYVAGITTSGDFPVTEGAIDDVVDAGDSFVAVLNLTSVVTPQLLYSTYLGGRGDDQGIALALVDAEGSLYVAGNTTSPDFPTTPSAIDRDCGSGEACEGGWDAFLARILVGADLVLSKSGTPPFTVSGGTITYTLAITNSGPAVATGVRVTDTLPLSVTLQSIVASQGSCSGTAIVVCEIGRLRLGDSVTITLAVRIDPEADGTLVNRAEATAEQFDRNVRNNRPTQRTPLNLDRRYFLPWVFG